LKSCSTALRRSTGADAVAGVVNVVTKSRLDGVEIEAQYGGVENSGLRELEVNFAAGRNFDGGNVALFVDYTDRKALAAADQDFTATDDRRSFFVGTPFETSSTPDSRATRGAWPNLATPAANGIIRRGTTALTTSSGTFNIRPLHREVVPTTSPLIFCLATGTISHRAAQPSLRHGLWCHHPARDAAHQRDADRRVQLRQ
jgi:outer membrane receptor protein involved in Fe transport